MIGSDGRGDAPLAGARNPAPGARRPLTDLLAECFALAPGLLDDPPGDVSNPFHGTTLYSARHRAGAKSGKGRGRANSTANCAEVPADWRVYLRRQHPAKTAEAVSAKTGLALGTVRGWLEHRANPSFDAMLVLVESYGPAFLASVMGSVPVWLRRALAEDRVMAIEETLEQALEDLRRSREE